MSDKYTYQHLELDKWIFDIEQEVAADPEARKKLARKYGTLCNIRDRLWKYIYNKENTQTPPAYGSCRRPPVPVPRFCKERYGDPPAQRPPKPPTPPPRRVIQDGVVIKESLSD